MRPIWIVGVVSILIAGGLFWMLHVRIAPASLAQAPVAARVAADAHYVGAATCATCHEREWDTWQGSDHDLAMQVAQEGTVLGNFDNATFTYAGTTTTFLRRDGKYIVNTDGPDGQLHDYPIGYTFGVHPLQQYLIDFPDGRKQALSIAWDSRPKEQGGQRWFHLYPNDNVKAGDWLHWTKYSQNWNYSCAECHSTDLRKNFDPASNTYKTTWAEINVACESCHGPGSNHVAWAHKEDDWQTFDLDKGLKIVFDERHGVVWNPIPETGNAHRNVPRRSTKEIDGVRAVPCACESPDGRLRSRHVAARFSPTRPAGRRSVLDRRADARGGLQLGLVRAKQNVRAGRDVF